MSEDVIIPRLLAEPERSFFLFGPRGTGKSTWLQQVLPNAHRFDFLDASVFLELSRDPHHLEAMIGNRPARVWIVLDEIQKIPALLDEVHRLIEARKWRFALCGSSARKLRRGGANLLAGRASTLSMETFSAAELENAFDLEFALNWGSLPIVQNEPKAASEILTAYVNTYLKEELQAEGIIRSVPPFIRFLSVAGQINGQAVNAMNIARDASVARSTVDAYFTVLNDTLVGHFLRPWRPGLKVREAAQPKFYWFDPGVARAAAGLHREPADRMWQGTSLETLVYHELRVYNEVSQKQRPVFYYRTPAGVEMDFIVETLHRRPNTRPHIVVIEVKRSERWERAWDKNMRALAELKDVQVDRLIGVYCGSREYQFENVQVLPFVRFVKKLFLGEIF